MSIEESFIQGSFFTNDIQLFVVSFPLISLTYVSKQLFQRIRYNKVKFNSFIVELSYLFHEKKKKKAHYSNVVYTYEQLWSFSVNTTLRAGKNAPDNPMNIS